MYRDFKPVKLPRRFEFGIRKININHCQLRNEASDLKSHLYHDFLTDDPTFPNCMFKS